MRRLNPIAVMTQGPGFPILTAMKLFRKHDHNSAGDSLRCEAQGLGLLADALRSLGADQVAVPEVVSVSEEELVLPAIDSRPATPALMAALGEALAGIHRIRQPSYGFGSDNYIGLAHQKNRWADDWGEFFVADRLGYQVSLIHNPEVQAEFSEVLGARGWRLASFLNSRCEHPSLLHGDLWSGNVLFDDRCAWLIDPAVYYGDREADLAMTEFFGGFSPEFYSAYDRVYPTTQDYPTKRAIYNLYHALNHYNLFGGAYLETCRRHLAVIRTLPS